MVATNNYDDLKFIDMAVRRYVFKIILREIMLRP